MKYLAFLVACFASHLCWSQAKQPSFNTFFNDCVIQGSMIGTRSHTIPSNFSTIFSALVSFDKNGAVDSIYFSDKLDTIAQKAYCLDNSLLKRMKAHNLRYVKYASQSVLGIFYFKNYKDSVDYYKSGLLKDFSNILPENACEKPIIMLKPFINQYSITQN